MRSLCFYLCIVSSFSTGSTVCAWYLGDKLSIVLFQVTMVLFLCNLAVLVLLEREKATKKPDQEYKERIADMLNETQEDFLRGFKSMAYSDTKKDQRKFVAIYSNLLEMVYGKSVKLISKDVFDDLRRTSREGGEL